jgi:Flp pilus assembly pilin Flp
MRVSRKLECLSSTQSARRELRLRLSHQGPFHTDERGTSAIEFAFFASILAFAILNVADISIYLYKRMQVENATQMGAQAAWNACTSANPGMNLLPATTMCSGLTTAITNAIHSTSLSTAVSLQAGSPAEGYYCVNGSGQLQYVSAVSSKPADCTVAGVPSNKPGDYIKITTSYNYAPIFNGVSVARTFPTPIVRTSMMRLNSQ